MTALYGVRALFVLPLGMTQRGIPTPPQLTAATLPMTPGEPAYFFTVWAAAEDRYWLVGRDDPHLKAALGIIGEPLPGGENRFFVVTLVHYNNRAGPVYFNVIRPFHHLVVGAMVRAAARGPD